jgi:hypothetical protein
MAVLLQRTVLCLHRMAEQQRQLPAATRLEITSDPAFN